jgi:hypothetical protein
MIHPHTELRFVSSEIGHGVVATRLIPRGTITWVRDDLDQVFSAEEINRMPGIYREVLDKYTFVDSDGLRVLCWDQGRYVNHYCRATCLSTGYDFEIAVRDILPGEELTDDYGTLNLEDDFECKCGLPDCRRVIHPDDPLRYADLWDAIVGEVFPMIDNVAQPLWQLIKAKREVELALAGVVPLASCRLNYFAAQECSV